MIGKTLAHYRILDRLGSGGMGEVYLAEDTKLQRQVALKVLHTSQSRELLRLHAGARAASALQHPSVAHIYELAEAEGLSFLVMEYVRGSSLAALIRDESLDIQTAVDIATEIADALVEAQAKGITHRDLKPANIMINERGTPKILDFGLARVHRPTDRGPRLTAPGVMVGTLDYMSPEQALASEADTRSDIFSLGVMLYEMVTGQRPFSGSNTAERMNQLLHFEPESPMVLNPAVPAELARIIGRCTAKLPSDRYQTASELLADLRILRQPREQPAISSGAPATPSRRTMYVIVAIIAMAIIAAALFAARRHLLGLRAAPISSLSVLPSTSNPSQPETHLRPGNQRNSRVGRTPGRGPQSARVQDHCGSDERSSPQRSALSHAHA